MNISKAFSSYLLLRKGHGRNFLFLFVLSAVTMTFPGSFRANGQSDVQATDNLETGVGRLKLPSLQGLTTDLLGGNVLKLNGIDGYVRVNPDHSQLLQGPFSIEMWAYMDNWAGGSSPARTGLVSKLEHGAGGYELGLDLGFESKSVGFSVLNCGTAVRSRTNLSGGWHHFIGTFDGRSVKFFTDGVLSASTANTASNCAVSYPYNYELRFGRSARNDGYGNNYFNGSIDEVRIYNMTLTPTDAQLRFNNGKGLFITEFEPRLIAGWHFDSSSGNIAQEYSGRATNGTVLNGSVWMPRNIPPGTIVALQVQNVTPDSAEVTWTTASLSNSTIDYGVTSKYGHTKSDETLTTSHRVKLTGLLPFTTYNFRVKSRLQNGQIILSGNRTFLTLDRPPVNNQFYVSPVGSALGNGAFGSPWDLRTALSHPAVIQPGATIWMRGGRYTMPAAEGGFVSNLRGSEQMPIIVKSFPGELAVMDGNLSGSSIKNTTVLRILGDYTWFMDFEITNSETATRKIATTGSNPTERRGNSVDDYGVGTKLINLIIHDTGQGIGAWQQGQDNEYYGNIVYNNGWDAPDRLHGHGTYTQNNIGYKRFVDNVIFNQFGLNSQTGGSNAASVRNYTWEGNTFFNGGMAWQGPNIENLKVLNNYTYNNGFAVGNEVNSTYFNAEVTGNYFMSGVQLFDFANGLIFQNNTVWNENPNGKSLVLTTNSSDPASIYSIENNTYYQSNREFPYWHFKIAGGSRDGDYAFNRWQGTQAVTYAYTGKSWTDDLGFDLASTYIDSVPTETKVFIRRNNYNPKRATIIVYNWQMDNSVSVDLRSILAPGEGYELRNAQDYFGDVITGTFQGTSVSIPMTGRTRAKPIGYDEVPAWYHDPLRANTFPRFGVFILAKK